MKPLHERMNDVEVKIDSVIETLKKIESILTPVVPDKVDTKTPEELKADIIATVNNAFKDAGVETPVVDSTVVEDVNSDILSGEVIK